jgi:hypothetical protein
MAGCPTNGTWRWSRTALDASSQVRKKGREKYTGKKERKKYIPVRKKERKKEIYR